MAVIKQVADAVGSPHQVDLTNFDLLVLIDIYKVRRVSTRRQIKLRNPQALEKGSELFLIIARAIYANDSRMFAAWQWWRTTMKC